MNKMKVCLFGASGLVGSELLELLLNDNQVSSVVCFSRRPIDRKHEKLSQVIGDFNRLQQFTQELAADVYFCCLGTTIKSAGSKEAFAKVDYDYVVEVGKLAKANSAKNLSVISAMGADENSSIFYNQTKGKAERALKSLELSSCTIVRPSLLLGPRKELRIGEKLFTSSAFLYSFLLKGPLLKYRPIEASQVAQAMLKAGKQQHAGFQIIENNEMF